MEEQALILSLYYLDDMTLLSACQSNKKIYQRVCNNIWIKRIMDRFGLSIDDIRKYKGNMTYSSYYFHLKDVLYSKEFSFPDDKRGLHRWMTNMVENNHWSNITRVLAENIVYRKYDIMKAAIYLGADINFLDIGETIFHKNKSYNDQAYLVKFLVNAGSDPDNFIGYATDVKVIQYLTSKGGDINLSLIHI